MLKQILGLGLALLALGLGVATYWGRSHRSSQLGSRTPVPTTSTSLSLPEQETQYLWDLEHHHNVLQEFGFKPVCKALRDSNWEALEKCLSPGFEARVFAEANKVAAESEAFSVTRETRSGDAHRTLDAAEFVEWLGEYRRRFSKSAKAKFDVMLVTPPSHDAFDGTWRVRCVLRIWGDDLAKGPLEMTARMVLEVERPKKERLAGRGWWKGVTLEQIALVGARQPLFADVTAESGIQTNELYDNWRQESKMINTGGVYALDYNRDGYIDLFLTDVNTHKLYRGVAGGKFEDATTDAGLGNISSGAMHRVAVFDYDNDGWVDLATPNVVFRNTGQGGFEDATYRTNLRQLLDPRAAASIPGDFDRDGLVDLYVCQPQKPTGSWLENRIHDGPQNQLLRNRGNGNFEDVTEKTNAGGGGLSTFTAAWLDYNQDDWPDLYAINEFGNGLLFENENGRSFRPREIMNGPLDFGSMGLSAGDVDNDGLVDLYLSNMYSKAGSRVIGNLSTGHYSDHVMAQLRALVAGSELYLNRGSSRFDPVGKAWQVHGVGWSWGSALADLDNDGWQDIYACAGFMSRDRSKPDG